MPSLQRFAPTIRGTHAGPFNNRCGSVTYSERRDFRCGSKCEELNVSKSSPLCLTEQTSMRRDANFQKCHGTKSLRSSPLRGSTSREARNLSREDSDSAVAKLVT